VTLGTTARSWPILLLTLAACDDDETRLPENCLETATVSVAANDWQYSSRPISLPPESTQLRDADRLGILWYPIVRHVTCGDLFPTETVVERNRYLDALGIILLPTTPQGAPWAGLTQPLANTGADLSGYEFMEIWINDFNRLHGPGITGNGEELRIDLGRFSEDAVWDPRTPPAPANGRLDDEDQDFDGQRTLAEDSGLDGLRDHDEVLAGVVPDASMYPASTSEDPAGDDYSLPADLTDYSGELPQRIVRFRKVSGFEGNQRLDSEALDGNPVLDLENDYVEYVVPLAGSAQTVVDVRLDYALSDPENGWRLLRIPLDQVAGVAGNPDLASVQAIRIWFKGINAATEFHVAAVTFGP